MATLAAYPMMMRRDRHRLELRECRAAWLLGVKVRQYRQLEAGESGMVTADVWERMVDVFSWPRASVVTRGRDQAGTCNRRTDTCEQRRGLALRSLGKS